MTPLPSLPANLDPSCISCGTVSALTTGIQGAAQAAIGTAVSGPLAQAQGLVAQATAASAATQAIIDAALSDAIIDELLERFRVPPSGLPDIQCVRDELIKIHDTLNTTNETTIEILQGPPVDLAGLITSLIPEIPVPVIPSPGEIKERIMLKLEQKQQEQQEALMKLQKARKQVELSRTTFV